MAVRLDSIDLLLQVICVMTPIRLHFVVLFFLLTCGQKGQAHGLGFFRSAEQAVDYARKNDGLLIIIFTGMDWSQRCHEMDVQVWEDSDFAEFANSSAFALLNADYPQRTKLTPAQQEELRQLAERHQIRHFPTTLALTPDLVEVGRHEYQSEDAETMISVLESWMEKFTLLKKGSLRQDAGATLADPSRAGADGLGQAPALMDLRTGDPLPELTFTSSAGKPLPLASLRGNAVLLTFIFTRCPLPDYCPLLGQKFHAVQTRLTEKKGAPENWRLLSLTIDPKNDTPEVLAKYAELKKANPKHWLFATSDLSTITQLALAFGADFWADKDGFITHHMRTVLVAPDGRIHSIHQNNGWSAEDLANQLEELALSHSP
jgi:cytochrome oxidase Cu insertion factor (SCO1/SenC/PrrC family)